MGTVSPIGSFADVWNNAAYKVARADVSGHRLLNQLKGRGQLGQVQTVRDFVNAGSICQGCQMPIPMLDLYSHRADLVVQHFLANAGETYRDLVPAFESVRQDAARFELAYAALKRTGGARGFAAEDWRSRLPQGIQQLLRKL